jgi:hypothetical protein
MNRRAKSVFTESPAKQIASFSAEFNSQVARLIRSARVALRKRFPTAIEQVYEITTFSPLAFVGSGDIETAWYVPRRNLVC